MNETISRDSPLKVPEAVAEGPQRQHPIQLQGEEGVQGAPHHR
jgi:hypothetical protein